MLKRKTINKLWIKLSFCKRKIKKNNSIIKFMDRFQKANSILSMYYHKRHKLQKIKLSMANWMKAKLLNINNCQINWISPIILRYNRLNNKMNLFHKEELVILILNLNLILICKIVSITVLITKKFQTWRKLIAMHSVHLQISKVLTASLAKKIWMSKLKITDLRLFRKGEVRKYKRNQINLISVSRSRKAYLINLVKMKNMMKNNSKNTSVMKMLSWRNKIIIRIQRNLGIILKKLKKVERFQERAIENKQFKQILTIYILNVIFIY